MKSPLKLDRVNLHASMLYQAFPTTILVEPTGIYHSIRFIRRKTRGSKLTIELKIVNEKTLELVIVKGIDEVLKHLPYTSIHRLHPLEALYLLYNSVATVTGHDGKNYTFEDLIKKYSQLNPYAWVEFEVYLDLRKRGRLPVPGPRPHSILLRRRKREPKYTHYILVLEENRPVRLVTLYSFVEEATKNGWEPLLAIVDRYGDITYYTASIFRPGLTRLPREGGTEP